MKNDQQKETYREPEIFLQSFELSKLIFKSSALLPKPTRYVLGRKLEEKILEFSLKLNQIVGPSGVRFHNRTAKKEHLVQLSYLLDEFRILIRMAREIGAYSSGHYDDLVQRTGAIGRQIGGMIRSLGQSEL